MKPTAAIAPLIHKGAQLPQMVLAQGAVKQPILAHSAVAPLMNSSGSGPGWPALLIFASIFILSVMGLMTLLVFTGNAIARYVLRRKRRESSDDLIRDNIDVTGYLDVGDGQSLMAVEVDGQRFLITKSPKGLGLISSLARRPLPYDPDASISDEAIFTDTASQDTLKSALARYTRGPFTEETEQEDDLAVSEKDDPFDFDQRREDAFNTVRSAGLDVDRDTFRSWWRAVSLASIEGLGPICREMLAHDGQAMGRVNLQKPHFYSESIILHARITRRLNEDGLDDEPFEIANAEVDGVMVPLRIRLSPLFVYAVKAYYEMD